MKLALIFAGRSGLSSPIVIHVLRPYASEEEYLAHESFSIDAKSMLLIAEPPLPAETSIIFDISLSNGQKPIRAEGKVLEYVAPVGQTPGGLRVRFKRFGAVTKAFIDRAVALSPASSSFVAEPRSPAPSMAPESRAAVPSLVPEPRAAAPSLVPESRPSAESLATACETNETSGIHRKTVLPVAAPANREALLGRLRARRAG